MAAALGLSGSPRRACLLTPGSRTLLPAPPPLGRHGQGSHRHASPPVCPEPQPSPPSGRACWELPHVHRAAPATHRRPGPASAHTRLPCLQSPRDTRTRSSRACCSSSRSGACRPSRASHTRLCLRETPRTQATVTRRPRSGLAAAPQVRRSGRDAESTRVRVRAADGEERMGSAGGR